jgi:predicted TIM-barrel fold metal-dependent hydrolase
MNSNYSRRQMLKSGLLAAASAAVGKTAFAQDGTLYQNQKNHWGWGAPPGQKLPEIAINGPWKTLHAVQQKKVFDIHVHGWETPKQGSNYMDEGHMHELGFVDYTNQLIASMDHHGVAMAALNPAFTTYDEVYEKSYQPHKDRFILSAGWPPAEIAKQQTKLAMTGNEVAVTPQQVADVYEKQLTQDGAKFIGETAGNVIIRGLMPRYSVKDLHPIVDVILKHDVPVQIHTGWTPTGTAISAGAGAGYQTANEWADTVGKFLAAFPQVKLILGHTGGQFGVLDGWEAIRLLYSFDNAYCDTAKAPPEIIQAAVQGIGAERVLFGSDWNRPELKEYGPYFYRATYQHWYNLNSVAMADLTDDQRDWVLYKSAHKLLKLD